MKKIALLIIIILCFSCKKKEGIGVDYSVLHKNENQDLDLDISNIFSKSQILSLSQKIIHFEEKTSHEIVLLTVDSISPFDNIEVYSSAIGDYWGVGKKDKDNGLVIVLRKNQKHIWLSTGTGTSKFLTDSVCQAIIDNTMIPYFRENNYFLGIDKGLDALMKQW